VWADLSKDITMLKIGSPITNPYGESGTVERNSTRTGEHLVRIADRWFIASGCKAG